MLLRDLFEDAKRDIDMRVFIARIAQRISSAIQNGAPAQYEVPIGKESYLGFDPKDLNIGDVLPDLLICLGQEAGKSELGKWRRLPPSYPFKQIIMLNYLDGNTPEATRTAASSPAFCNTLKHELTHSFDYQRTDDRIAGSKIKPKNDDDLEGYYNNDAENNAYFHDIASRLSEFAAEVKGCTSSLDAYELLGLSGLTGDFKHDLVALMKEAHVSSKGFLTWLHDDKQRKLIRRLYGIHQEIMRRIASIDTAQAA